MDALRRLICILVGLTVVVSTTILTMIYGWGLQPKSWLWIVVLNLAGAILGQLFIVAAKD